MPGNRVNLEDLLELAERAGVKIRSEDLAGRGGGLCWIRGQPVLFDDTSEDYLSRLDRALDAIAQLPGIEALFVPPAVREALDRRRPGSA